MRMAKSHASHTPAPASRLCVRDAGFSLIELLLVLLIFSVLTGAAMTLVINAYKTLQGRLSSSTALDRGLRAVNQMSREIRMAGFPSDKSFSTAAVTSYPGVVAIPFVTASAYDLKFEADTDGDGQVEQIEYVLASGSETIIRRRTLKNLNGSLATTTLVSTLFLDHVQNQTLSQPLFSWDLDPSSSRPFPQNIRTVYVNVILKPVGEQGGTAANVTLASACQRMNP
jgi:prepilin-type N-terminal cleavage/methylation domain-containing protein